MEDAPQASNMKALVDPLLPSGMQFCTTQRVPTQAIEVIRSRMIVSFVRMSWSPPSDGTNEQLSLLFQQNYRKIIFEVSLVLIPAHPLTEAAL